MTKLVFLLNLVIFGNNNQESPFPVLHYFKSLEPFLFVGDPRLFDAEEGDPSRISFLDTKIIL